MLLTRIFSMDVVSTFKIGVRRISEVTVFAVITRIFRDRFGLQYLF